jgi:stage II sporulation protein AA (anti-sigma F factor antagonist)
MSVGVISEFDADVRIENGCAVIALEGELDFGVQEYARATLDAIGDARVVVFDLRELTFMDTSGIHLLLAIRDRCRASGRMLLVVRGPASVHLGLAALGLDDEFEFVDGPSLAA